MRRAFLGFDMLDFIIIFYFAALVLILNLNYGMFKQEYFYIPGVAHSLRFNFILLRASLNIIL